MEASEKAAIAAGFKRIEIVAMLIGEPLYTKFGYQVARKCEDSYCERGSDVSCLPC
jgi:hypothetical protein